MFGSNSAVSAIIKLQNIEVVVVLGTTVLYFINYKKIVMMIASIMMMITVMMMITMMMMTMTTMMVMMTMMMMTMTMTITMMMMTVFFVHSIQLMFIWKPSL